MDLRDALEKALTYVPEEETEVREHIRALLDQEVENQYGKLVEECQVAIYG